MEMYNTSVHLELRHLAVFETDKVVICSEVSAILELESRILMQTYDFTKRKLENVLRSSVSKYKRRHFLNVPKFNYNPQNNSQLIFIFKYFNETIFNSIEFDLL